MTVNVKDREDLRRAWVTMCQELESAGHWVLDDLDDIDNPQELAEALRAVARMAMMCLQQRMEFNDPDFPRFMRSCDDRYKYAGPDSYVNYMTAQVRGTATYRVSVNHHGRPIQIGRFWTDEIKHNEDGSFELQVGGEEAAENWNPLRADDGEGPLKVPELFPLAMGNFGGRLYYRDLQDLRPSTMNIERIDPDRPRYPEPLAPAKLADQIDSATELFHAISRWWLERAVRIRTEYEPNVMGPPGLVPPGVPSYTPPKNWAVSPLYYGICCWELEEDEALLITTPIPDVEYWSFQTHNTWWESPENQHRQTSISNEHAHLDEDGQFRCVLSHVDPQVPNWLDVGGSRRGFVFYRWLRPVGDMPTPGALVVKIANLHEHLPSGHPHIDPQARDEMMARRRKWYAARFQS